MYIHIMEVFVFVFVLSWKFLKWDFQIFTLCMFVYLLVYIPQSAIARRGQQMA